MWSAKIILLYCLSFLLLWPALHCEETDEEGDLLSRVFGLPGVWWDHTHIFANAWSAVAAGLSSAVLGAALLPANRRSGPSRATERVFRGVVAQPHSWPWIAKLKVRKSSPAQTRERQARNFLCLDHIQTSWGSRETEGLWRGPHSGQVRPDGQTLRVLGPQRGRRGRQAGGGLAGQPRPGGPGWAQDPREENHHQAGLPSSDVCQVRPANQHSVCLGGCTAVTIITNITNITNNQTEGL